MFVVKEVCWRTSKKEDEGNPMVEWESRKWLKVKARLLDVNRWGKEVFKEKKRKNI